MTPFPVKPRPCAHCQSPFVPQRPLQRVCSPACAARSVKAKKAEERSQIRSRKEKIKTIPVLKKEAQHAFNAFIRARDAVQGCISCGAPPPSLDGLHAGRDAGHYRSIGSAAHLRYDEDNCHAQCVKCNQWKAGNAVDYRIGLVARIGEARVMWLEHDNVPRKWTAEELRSIRSTYTAKLKELKRRQT